MSAVPGGQDRPGRDGPAGVVSEARGAENGAERANGRRSCGLECVTEHTYIIGRCVQAGTVAADAGDDLLLVSSREVWAAVLTGDGGEPDGVVPNTAQCNRVVGMLRRRSDERMRDVVDRAES